jgi:cysteinyl-tRNA synthetase
LDDDLDTPGALSRMWDMTKDSALSPADMRATVADIDRILGLRLAHDDALAVDLTAKLFGRTIGTDELPADIVVLIEQREKARSDKDWNRADEIRAELLEKGYAIDDRPEGPLIKAR